MKRLAVLLLLSFPAFGQYSNDPRIITFNASDSKCCKISFVDGKRFIQMQDGDTLVGISEPINSGHGEFSVYVAISELGTGTAEVVPTDFSAWYSDPPHTRFPYMDRDAEVDRKTKHSMWLGILAAGLGGASAGSPRQASINNSDGTSSTVTYTDPNAQSLANAQSAQTFQAIKQRSIDAKTGLLHRNTVGQGASAGGVVFFKKPNSTKEALIKS